MCLIDVIKNNTESLVNQDLVSVLKKPPLDSMDLIRVKLLELAKKNKVVFHTEKLDSYLDLYRSFLLTCSDNIKKERISYFEKVVKNSKLRRREVIKVSKKDFVAVNKIIKGILKEQLADGYQKYIVHKFDDIFVDVIDEKSYEKIFKDFSKYMNGVYQKQILESCELKILVKDTTLSNAIKEQGDRYLFTLEHSHLLKDVDA